MLREGELAPNVVDMLILEDLLHPEGSSRDLSDAPDIAEIVGLGRCAFSDDTASKGAAQAVLFALRQSVAFDETGDRLEGIRQSEVVLQQIDATHFPVTAAGAHLKIGGALAIQAQSHGNVDVAVMRLAVTHLESALALLPPQLAAMRAMADCNAALACQALWQAADDWDGDDDVRDKALHHGLAAIDAMNGDPGVGNRDSVSRAVLSILLADGQPRDDKARDQLIAVLQAWLASPEGNALPREERATLEHYYHVVVALRDDG
jgi:hypothetical protein